MAGKIEVGGVAFRRDIRDLSRAEIRGVIIRKTTPTNLRHVHIDTKNDTIFHSKDLGMMSHYRISSAEQWTQISAALAVLA